MKDLGWLLDLLLNWLGPLVLNWCVARVFVAGYLKGWERGFEDALNLRAHWMMRRKRDSAERKQRRRRNGH